MSWISPSKESVLPDGAYSSERSALVRAGRLHFVHYGIVVALLILTLVAWSFSKSQLESASRTRFDRFTVYVEELIAERMELYENALWAGVAAIQSNGGSVSYDEWETFSQSLRMDTRYPGISGIGVIDHLSATNLDEYLERHTEDVPGLDVYPEHGGPELWPIRLIEPLAANRKAVGLDMAHEVNRRQGAERARDLGTAQITGPIALVQDSEQTPGFLFYAPIYSGSAERTSVAARREGITGLVYAPFIMNELLAGVLRKANRPVLIRILDGDEVIYDEHVASQPDYDPDPLFVATETFELYGRDWTFDFRSGQSFRAQNQSSQPTLILVVGIVMDALLLALFLTLTNSNRRAVAFADGATLELRRRTLDLERSNEELEKFAYVASHDLKTPLRGISDLAEYLEEDLEEYLSDSEAKQSVQQNLDRIGVQVARMNGLIKGILDYSSLESAKTTRGDVDLEELVDSTMRDLGVDASRWEVLGEPTKIETDTTKFTQVVTNLLTNAVKYNDQGDEIRIRLSVEDTEDFYRVRVADNGPGIAPRYHARVFEVFQTLQAKDVVDSTGIGLAIVKKSVDLVGGAVSIESTPESGATFIVDWPKFIGSVDGD